MGHVHVALAAPLGADDVAQAGGDEDQGAVSVGKCSDSPGAPADLAHDALERIIGAQAAPMLGGKLEILERLLDALGDESAAPASFISRSFATTSTALAWAAGRSSWAWIALSMAATSRTLDVGTAVHTSL